MTNVPQNIRDMWTDLYRLFDSHYLMDINVQDNWKEYWQKATELISKYQIDGMIDMLSAMAHMITQQAKERRNNEQ